MDEQVKHDYKELDEASDNLQHAQTSQANLMHQQEILKDIKTGALGEARAAISNWIETFAPGDKTAKSLENLLGLPDAQLAQQFQKLSLVAAGTQERENLGARGGYAATQLYLKANPGLNMQKEANREILNVKMVADQAEIDYLRGKQAFVNQHQQDYISNKSAYVPATEYDRQWQSQNNSRVYAAAMAAINGEPFDRWAKGLSKEEGLRVAQIVSRVNPTATILGGGGKQYPVAQLTGQATQ
jgi:hypothetical protein